MSFLGDTSSSKKQPESDIQSFDTILKEKRKIFLERRKKYGSHLANSQRFPNEHIYALYLKCVRTIRQIENGDIDHDTLLDLSNYCDIILSSKGIT